jgi:hypothetical protein
MNSVKVQDLAVIRDLILAYSVYVAAINEAGYKGAAELGETIAEKLTELIGEAE